MLGLRWSCGFVSSSFAIPLAVELRVPRACAFALLGLHEYLDSFPGRSRQLYGRGDELA